MNDPTAVTRDGASTIEGPTHDGLSGSVAGTDQTTTDSDGFGVIRPSDDAARQIGEAAEPSPHDPVTPGADAPATRPPVMVSARLRGGPAAGRHIDVPRIAGSFPMFIGVDGANYVRDKGSADTPVYNWWPAGASSPAGDPSARTDTR